MGNNKTTDLSKFDNSWYDSGNILLRVIWYFVNHIFFTHHLFPFNSFKTFLLSVFGAKVGKGVVIKPGVNIKYPWFLEIGNYTWIGENVWIDNLKDTKIGSNVCISQGAMLLCGNHNYKVSSFELYIRSIIIEDGVWIGAKSVVSPGVNCGSHSVLSVGSVAVNDLNAYKVYMGNPAEEVKDRVIKE